MWILTFLVVAVLFLLQKCLLKKYLKDNSAAVKTIHKISGIIAGVSAVFLCSIMVSNTNFNANADVLELLLLPYNLAVLTSATMLFPAYNLRKTSRFWRTVFTVACILIVSATLISCCVLYCAILSWKWALFMNFCVSGLIGHIILGTFSKKPIESTTRKIIGYSCIAISAISILSLICYGLYWVWYFLGGGLAVDLEGSLLEKIFYGGLALFLLFDVIVGIIYIFFKR